MSNATKDFLGRSERDRALVLARFDHFHALFREEPHADSCFKMACYETMTEDQWTKLLIRTRQLLEKMKG